MKRAALLLVLLCCVYSQLQVAAAPKPNFVVFIADDHGMLDSTPYGSKDARTPNMQRVADAGVTFTHMFIASPSCAPSRSAMLTGLMPARNGAEANHTFKKDGIASLTENLKAQGYELASFGKIAHGNSDVKRHGFDHFTAAYDAATVAKYLADRKDPARPIGLFVGTHHPHVAWPELIGYSPDKVVLPPIFVDTPKTREFRGRYLTDVTRADTEMGEIHALARKQFTPANTLFIYTSDHGSQWPFGKWNLYDYGIRVPFLAEWPGVIKPGTRLDAMTQWIDLFPTLIELAGGTIPPGIDGKSFAPVLLGKSTTHRDRIFTTQTGDGIMNVYPIRSVRSRDWKFILNLHPEFAHTTHIDQAAFPDRSEYWMPWVEAAKTSTSAAAILKRYHQRPAVELYDLRGDPFEQRNLAADPQQATRVAEMRAELEAWMKTQGDQQLVANKPRLLAEPKSWAPQTGLAEQQAGLGKKPKKQK